MIELPNTALQPTYAGFPVLLASILATLVAKSMLPGTAYSGVLRGSEGCNRYGCQDVSVSHVVNAGRGMGVGRG